ncbi:hypothetical protein LWI29_024683 [Acer saccharum]|uniref:Uncharacterized protein n=1 Tax=Acer saccharum TaxID=4024 RepID=A0AA39VNU6_ACESA|nr:hypothetical protein LWI29_024683 [Acer saccharum]
MDPNLCWLKTLQAWKLRRSLEMLKNAKIEKPEISLEVDNKLADHQENQQKIRIIPFGMGGVGKKEWTYSRCCIRSNCSFSVTI